MDKFKNVESGKNTKEVFMDFYIEICIPYHTTKEKITKKKFH